MSNFDCPYCGAKMRTMVGTCPSCKGLVDGEPEALAICTQSADCTAPADMHEPLCPVEKKLKETFGF